MKVINLFGSPGTGKSTTAAGLFHIMKLAGYNVELVTEFAKDLTWDCRKECIKDSLYILAKQNKRLQRLEGKVDVAITDSPLLLGHAYYSGKMESFGLFLDELFNSYDNLNIILDRTKPYNPIGRNQTEQESDNLAKKIKQIVIEKNIHYVSFDADEKAPKLIFDFLKCSNFIK